MKSYARADVKELTPAVGSLGGPQQLLAQLAQLVLRRTFLHSGCDILGRTSGLIDPIGQVGGFVSGEHHRIRGYRGALDRRPLLVGTLSAGLAAILASPTQLGVVDFTPAPLAGLSVFATCHVQQRSGGPFPRSRTAPVKPTPLGRRIVPVGQLVAVAPTPTLPPATLLVDPHGGRRFAPPYVNERNYRNCLENGFRCANLARSQRHPTSEVVR